MERLKGTHIPKEKLKDYLNKRVIYLFSRDIDRSGRGYFFPRIGTITHITRYNIDFDNGMEFQSLSDLREVVEVTDQSMKDNF